MMETTYALRITADQLMTMMRERGHEIPSDAQVYCENSRQDNNNNKDVVIAWTRFS